jgi:hypothetical protein
MEDPELRDGFGATREPYGFDATFDHTHGGRMASQAPGRRGWLTVVAVLAVGLAAGFGIARLSAAPEPAAARVDSDDVAAAEDDDEQVEVAERAGDPAPPAVAADAGAAVTAFLEAEVERDFETSWSYLSSTDREEFDKPAVWVNAHADLAPIEGFELDEIVERDGRVEAIVDLQLESQLNEFTGLIPARATGTYVVTEEDDGWRVVVADSVLRPQYPSADGVREAAAAWAEAHRSCEEPTTVYDGPLYGLPALALELCGTEGEVGVGEIGDLPEGERSAPFVSAFGPEVFNWARVAPLTGPVPISAVLAPIDDEWRVIGVIRADP